MRLSAYLLTFSVLLVLLGSAAPEAQKPGTYTVAATQSDLDDGGTLSGAVPTCLLPIVDLDASGPGVVFFDAASGALVSHVLNAPVGERTTVLVSAADFEILAGSDVVACTDASLDDRWADPRSAFGFLALKRDDGRGLVVRVDTATGDVILLSDLSDPARASDGIVGLVVVDGTVYLARSTSAGAPEAGVYTLPADGERQAPSVLLVDSRLDPTAIAHGNGLIYEGPGLFLASSSDGRGDFRNVIAIVTGFRGDSPGLVVGARPCDGPEALFDECDSGLGDLETDIEPDGGDASPLRVMVSRPASEGAEFAVAAYTFWDTPEAAEPRGVVFRESELRAQTEASGVSIAGSSGYLTVPLFSLQMFVASVGSTDTEPAIYSVITPYRLASEPEPLSEDRISVYPNPASGAVTLRLSLRSPEAVRVWIVDVVGRVVASASTGVLGPGGHLVTVDTRGLVPGTYLVRSSASEASGRVTVLR